MKKVENIDDIDNSIDLEEDSNFFKEKKDYSDIEKAEIIREALKTKYEPKFDDIFTIPNIDLSLKKVEKGVFLMGSDNGADNEKPVHKVHITNPYWMGIYPVTQKQYAYIMNVEPSHFTGDNRPVEKISWNQAIKFCKLLTEKERKAGNLPEPYVYRLPTEAEWEYACRADQKENFFLDVEEYIWYYKNSNEQTHEVGLKTPNPWGFFDMQGNVFEWCQDSCDFKFPDWYESGNLFSPLCKDNVINPCWEQGSNRIAKGGAWLFGQKLATPSSKYINPPDSRYFVISFRLVLGLPVHFS